MEGCGRDLVDEKDYYRRYKVCHAHAVEPSVMVRGAAQRFCQQCGTFHAITDFDQDKRCVHFAFACVCTTMITLCGWLCNTHTYHGLYASCSLITCSASADETTSEIEMPSGACITD